MKLRIGIGLLVLALSATLIWLLARYDFSLLTRLSPGIVALLVTLSVLYSWLYGAGVTLILRSIGLRCGAWRVFLVISGGGTASYLGNVQLGIPLRLFLFHRLLEIPYALGAASIALETACWFSLMGLGLVVAGTAANYAPWVATALLVASLGLVHRFALPLTAKFLGLVPETWGRIPLGKVRRVLAELVTALQKVDWGWLSVAVLVFTINYAIDAGTVWLVAHNYGETIDLWDALAAIILSYLAGLLSLIPMGIGVREISMVALLVKGGLSHDVATTVALVLRALRTVVPLAIGLIAINLLGMRALLRTRENPTDSESNTAPRSTP
jgi:uncharacterized protein (TIRG00374 family)